MAPPNPTYDPSLVKTLSSACIAHQLAHPRQAALQGQGYRTVSRKGSTSRTPDGLHALWKAVHMTRKHERDTEMYPTMSHV
eukprot:1140850-Pelagomonas_calceolata.AAC.6